MYLSLTSGSKSTVTECGKQPQLKDQGTGCQPVTMIEHENKLCSHSQRQGLVGLAGSAAVCNAWFHFQELILFAEPDASGRAWHR